MCLALFSFQSHPDYHLVLAANRDEFFERPTAPADFWESDPDLLAGRDLRGGGTWLGVTRQGRIAFITNYREQPGHNPDAPSRGNLVTDYLRGNERPREYLGRIARSAEQYNGFNLLTGDLTGLFYYSNRDGHVRSLSPGIYGLSNHLLNTPWPKVERGIRILEERLEGRVLDPEKLLDALKDTVIAADGQLPDTGFGLEWERVLSPMFIHTPTYGTRSSTVVLIDRQHHVIFTERTYDSHGVPALTRSFEFDIVSSRSHESSTRK